MGNCFEFMYSELESKSKENEKSSLDLTQHDVVRDIDDGVDLISSAICSNGKNDVLGKSHGKNTTSVQRLLEYTQNLSFKADLCELDYSRCGAASFSGLSIRGFAPKATKQNQDAMMMSFDIVTDTLVVACFDGHGEQGDLVAQFLRDKLTEQLICHPHFSSDLQLALKETIKSAERLLLQRYYRNCSFSGSTMALCAIRDSKIVTANIGDSRVVLCSNGVASALTTDHKADLPEERRRITSAGGRVIVRTYDDGYSGPARVYLAHADIPGLAMSRSLGDYISHEVGVSSEPDVIERDITSQDQFLIIATDGLWDFTTNQEAANITLSCASADAAVSAMIQKSYTKWSSKVGCVMDDTSAIVVFLHQGTY